MESQVYAFRPGEARRKLARWQFGLYSSGRCGAGVTHSIPGMAWRHNIKRAYEGQLTKEVTDIVFSGLVDFYVRHRIECLDNAALWSDSSEQCNGITRDQATNTLCFTFGILEMKGAFTTYYSVKENSSTLLNAKFFQIIIGEIRSYDETLA